MIPTTQIMKMETTKKKRVLFLYKPSPLHEGFFPGAEFLWRFLKDEGYELFTDVKRIDDADIILLISLSLYHKVRKVVLQSNKKIYALPFLDDKNFKRKKDDFILLNEKVLNLVNFVLCETTGQVDFLKKKGVVAPIKKMLFSKAFDQRINISKLEKSVFPRYFGVQPGTMSFCILGPSKQFAIAQSLAKMLPEATIVFTETTKGSIKKKRINEKITNLHYEMEIREELYSSSFATINAIVILDKWMMNPIVALDSIASCVPIISIRTPLLEDLIMPSANYISTGDSPIEIFEILNNIQSDPITEISRNDIIHKLKYENKTDLSDFLAEETR